MSPPANALAASNNQLVNDVKARRDQLIAAHQIQMGTAGPDPLGRLIGDLHSALREAGSLGDLTLQWEPVERSKHGADIALKFPSLLERGGPKVFSARHVSWIVNTVSDIRFADAVASVESVGIYVNITLRDAWLLDSARQVVRSGTVFGKSAVLADQRVVLDYSSPNVAKTLHAGHIRSTIIGHVLAAILEEAGALVFRVNHINDFGGFGFLLEGHRRFESTFSRESTINDRSLVVYRLRRVLEQIKAEGSLEALTPTDRDLLAIHLPAASDANALAAEFASFTKNSDARLAALEAGDSEEVTLWRKIVDASVHDFASFYESLGVTIDFVMGESLYSQLGAQLVSEWLDEGRATVYSRESANADLAELCTKNERLELSDSELASNQLAIEKDLEGVVVRLSNAERLVILRRDGRGIYATRDLAAIALRKQIFRPTRCIYVVGQEQQSHFSRLFAAAERLGIVDPDEMSFKHLYFGFYVDAHTKKKLSSRASATGVISLLDAAHTHFLGRSSQRPSDADDPQEVAKQLTIASIVFNDLKQDVRSAVEIDVDDPEAVIQTFEKSGGAYVIYTACRAGSIVRKVESSEAHTPIVEGPLKDDSVNLLVELLRYPSVVLTAASSEEPARLIRHLLHLSNLYNSSYTKYRVITDSGISDAQLTITAAVQQTLRNGLRLCNVDCPVSI